MVRPALTMTTWQAAGASVRGESHRASGSPNQDSIQWTIETGPDHPGAVVALADGHGSARSFRSETGARIASEMAIRILPEVVAQIDRFDHVPGQSVVDTIANRILTSWRTAVAEHLETNAFTAAERERLHSLPDGTNAFEDLQRNPLVAYGATLVAAAATPQAIVLVQLGDGDTLAVSNDGIVSRPLPPDDRLIANETRSLSTAAGRADFRISFLPSSVNPPELILVSSDGYANSFADDEAFEKIGSDLIHMLRERGLGWVQDQLDEWLTTASREGSGDDISLGLLWRPQDAPGGHPATRGLRSPGRSPTTVTRQPAPHRRPRRPTSNPINRWVVVVALIAAAAVGYILTRLYLALS